MLWAPSRAGRPTPGFDRDRPLYPRCVPYRSRKRRHSWPKLLSLVRTSSNRKPPSIDRDLDAAPVRLARLSSPQEAGPPRGLYPSRSAPSERSPYSQPIVTRRCSVAPKICWFGPRPRYWVVGDDSQGRLRTREAHVGKGECSGNRPGRCTGFLESLKAIRGNPPSAGSLFPAHRVWVPRGSHHKQKPLRGD
jgi:hypothetical protein